MKNLTIKRELWLCVIFTLICLIITGVAIDGIKDEKLSMSSGIQFAQRDTYSFSETFTNADDVLVQYFVPQREYISSIDIRLAVNWEDIDTSNWLLDLELYNEKGQLIKQERIKTDDFENWRYYTFKVEEDVKRGEEHRLEIRQLNNFADIEEPWNLSIVCFTDTLNLPENTRSTYNGIKSDYNIDLVYNYKYIDYRKISGVIISGVVCILVIGYVFLCKNTRKKEYKVEAFCLWSIAPIAMFVISEMITGNLKTIHATYWFLNILWNSVLLALLCLLFRRVKTATIVYCVIIIVASVAQRYVTVFRGRPFMLLDFQGVQTLTTVIGSYHFSIYADVCIGLQWSLMFIAIQYSRQWLAWRKSKYIWVSRISLMLALASVCAINLRQKSSAEMWKVLIADLNKNYAEKGFLHSLLSVYRITYVEEPDGYSDGIVQKILDEGIRSYVDQKIEIEPQHIIMIMNESFTDLGHLSEVKTENELLPYFKEIQANAISGWLQVPVIGGGTAETEYEVLTGNSKQFLAIGSSAYEMYCKEAEQGMVENLNNLGYYTLAMHPSYASNWSRGATYNKMGFDEFISFDNWEYPVEVLRAWISDKSAYERLIIEAEEHKEDKLFTFLVTLQNHGGYENGNMNGYVPNVDLEYDRDFVQAETYLSMVNDSDEAFRQIIEYYSQVEIPAMVVMFGDHLPYLADGYIEYLVEDIEDDVEKIQLQYHTPYVIWKNYQQTSYENELMSSNYFGAYVMEVAGLELSDYQKYLMNLKEKLPVVGMGYIADKHGIWYEMDNLPMEYQGLIDDYKRIQYKRVFDR